MGLLSPGAGSSLDAAISPLIAILMYGMFTQIPFLKLREALSNLRFMMALLIANFIAVPVIVWVLITRSTLSTQNGFYILFGLPPGRYVIRVRAFGYPEKFVEVTLLEGQVLRLDIQLGNVNPPPPNDLRPECIKADKLYDWVFAPFRESQKVMIPPDCRGIVEDALALGEDVTISCSTGAASCRVIGYENGRPGVVNVRMASAPNYTSAQGGATVTSGGTAVVNLTIVPNPASVSGRITTTGGAPLATSKTSSQSHRLTFRAGRCAVSPSPVSLPWTLKSSSWMSRRQGLTRVGISSTN